MIVVTAAAVADVSPSTDVAMLFRIGIGNFRAAVRHGEPQATLDLSEVGGVVREPVSLRLKRRPRHDDVHVLWHEALHLSQQVGVQAKLENRSRLRLARQLGLNRLVRPAPEGTRRIVDAAQDVDSSRPALVGKRALHDHPYALVSWPQAFRRPPHPKLRCRQL